MRNSLKPVGLLVVTVVFLLGNWNGHRQADKWWKARALVMGTEPGEAGKLYKASDNERMPLKVEAIPAVSYPPKPWTTAMCSKVQEYAGQEYITFCISQAPGVFPKCFVGQEKNDPRAVIIGGWGGGGGAYFEVLDCSWHSGSNPREEKKP